MDIRQIAVKYIKSLSEQDRKALKEMVFNGVQVAQDYAKRHNVTSEQITSELKAIFKE